MFILLNLQYACIVQFFNKKESLNIMTPEKIPEKSESRIKRTPKSFCKISCDV